MAPFNIHLLVAEKLWLELDGLWQHHWGQYYFGCLAPDVHKISGNLTQKDMHFFDSSSRKGPPGQRSCEKGLRTDWS